MVPRTFRDISLRLCAFLPLLLPVGCAPPLSIHYSVTISGHAPGPVKVASQLHHVPRDGVTLTGFGAAEFLRISDASATTDEGVPLVFVPGVNTVAVNSASLKVPSFFIPGPLPSHINFNYTITPGTREGDEHLGYTGHCYGYAGADFALLTGRNLFLLPQGLDVRDFRVRFSVPTGWSVYTPWIKQAGDWIPSPGSRLAAEDLISASLGFGHFRDRATEVGKTHYHFVTESSIPIDTEARLATRLTEVVHYLHDLTGRDLGPDYWTIIVPKSPAGDDILGSAWSGGQGSTLVPITPSRVHGFAEHLLDAYLRYAPYRTEIRHRDEFWLIDAIRGLYSWKAVAHAGYITPEQLLRGLEYEYFASLNTMGVERNLERLSEASGRQRTAREVVAPEMLAFVGHELQRVSGGVVNMDQVVHRLLRGTVAPSIWALLEDNLRGGLGDIRSKYVRGSEPLPPTDISNMRPTTLQPTVEVGPTEHEITLAYSGGTNGYLENCGCKGNQSGGMARRATVLARIRRQDPQALVLDAGDAFVRPKNQDRLDYFTLKEQAFYLQLMDRLRYNALAVNSTELVFGPGFFLDQTRQVKSPYLSSNIQYRGKPLTNRRFTTRIRGIPVTVMGVYEQAGAYDDWTALEDGISELVIDDPAKTIAQQVPTTSSDLGVLIVIGRLSPSTIRWLVEEQPNVDVIVSSDNRSLLQGASGNEPQLKDAQGFIGSTLVLYTDLTSYGIKTARFGIDSRGRLTGAILEDHWLDERIPDDPAIRASLTAFYQHVGKEEAAQKSVAPLFQGDSERQNGPYVGVKKCTPCHESEHRQWLTTAHSVAYRTLLDRHRHFQPRCVSCHVVGYGTRFGYRLGSPDQTLVDVQCEVCHGPGGEHVSEPRKENIQRLVPAGVCLECHTPEHSNRFVYEERIARVRHDAPPTHRSAK